MKKNILLGLSLLVISLSHAQTYDSLFITPENPTNLDSVKVTCYSTFMMTPCSLIMAPSVDINEMIITVTAQHVAGMAPSTCHDTTITDIGILSPGDHKLIYRIITPVSIVPSVDTLDFTVANVTSLEQLYKDVVFKVYPNPAGDYAGLYYDFSNFNIPDKNITLTDMQGRVIEKVKIIDTKGHLTFSRKLDSGIYMVNVLSGENMIISRKLVKL